MREDRVGSDRMTMGKKRGGDVGRAALLVLTGLVAIERIVVVGVACIVPLDEERDGGEVCVDCA